ncbi:uncharacterized protein KGF55_002388 [Candida pseudojiufengensis]|uniref:uncharacterized protein n=1 Tax=Candida pseudojiufengensis TaxID=497109 RepID=UPI00222460BC|nr:uncharacterized protein KGF55_002388 [Candida pseudojiufengensis]KAI5963508.1 hypothetical protein KGF55_002388 [Candida pseudojiufengensis]
MIQLKGKVALVTGGSAGLGASISEQLAAEGVNVAINYSNNEKRASELSNRLIKLYGIESIIIKADIFDIQNLHKLVEETVSKLGRIDILISNAGWTEIIPYDNLDAMTEEIWDNTFSANVKAHYFLFKAVKPYFDSNKEGGTFISSASVAGRTRSGSSIPYSVSKAALIQLIKFLAKTQPNIRTHAVCPGLLAETDWGKRFSNEQIQKSINLSPIKKSTDIEECASEYIHLCKLSTSTGSIVASDAGLSIL